MSLFLKSWCLIRNHRIAVDGETVFDGAGAENAAAFLNGAYRHFRVNYPRFYKMDLLCKLALIAGEALLRRPGARLDTPPGRVGLVFFNKSASAETDLSYLSTIRDKSNYFPSPSVFVYTLPNVLMGELCMRHRFQGECVFFVDDSFNPGLLSRYINCLADDHAVDAVLGGWVESEPAVPHEAMVFLADRETSAHACEAGVLHNLYLRDRQA